MAKSSPKKNKPAPGKKPVAKHSTRKSAVKKSPGKQLKKAIKKTGKTAFAAEVRNTAMEVKEIIVANSPLTGIEAADLINEMTLSGNLSYKPANKTMLTVSLDEYVNNRDSSQHITATEMANVKTVENTINLVKNKLHETV
jgi:hypothetical protein